jgi:hypothetical protein
LKCVQKGSEKKSLDIVVTSANVAEELTIDDGIGVEYTWESEDSTGKTAVVEGICVVVDSVMKIAVDEVLVFSDNSDVETSKVISEFEETVMISEEEFDSSTVTEVVKNALDEACSLVNVIVSTNVVEENSEIVVVVVSKVDVAKSIIIEIESIVVRSEVKENCVVVVVTSVKVEEASKEVLELVSAVDVVISEIVVLDSIVVEGRAPVKDIVTNSSLVVVVSNVEEVTVRVVRVGSSVAVKVVEISKDDDMVMISDKDTREVVPIKDDDVESKVVTVTPSNDDKLSVALDEDDSSVVRGVFDVATVKIVDENSSLEVVTSKDEVDVSFVMISLITVEVCSSVEAIILVEDSELVLVAIVGISDVVCKLIIEVVDSAALIEDIISVDATILLVKFASEEVPVEEEPVVEGRLSAVLVLVISDGDSEERLDVGEP